MPILDCVSRKDITNLLKHPNIIVIDVRDPRVARKRLNLPNSINILLTRLKKALKRRPEEFKQKYGRVGPNPQSLIIFHTRTGIEAEQASETALALGYKNVKYYRERLRNNETKDQPEDVPADLPDQPKDMSK